eukprot:scaffold345_cov104-Isochrysis_galbana.AAC.4
MGVRSRAPQRPSIVRGRRTRRRSVRRRLPLSPPPLHRPPPSPPSHARRMGCRHPAGWLANRHNPMAAEAAVTGAAVTRAAVEEERAAGNQRSPAEAAVEAGACLGRSRRPYPPRWDSRGRGRSGCAAGGSVPSAGTAAVWSSGHHRCARTGAVR